jgi:D-serine deaminase-like pyridoxal phosphate-dependent protein
VGDLALAVGDVLRFGVTHSCTAFDKRPLIPALDDSAPVVSTVTMVFNNQEWQ